MSKNKSYRKGYNFEREVARWFQEREHFVVRQGKSKFPDLIAITKADEQKSSKVLLIECKYNKKPTRSEIERLLELEELTGGIGVIALKKKGQKGFELKFLEEIDGGD